MLKAILYGSWIAVVVYCFSSIAATMGDLIYPKTDSWGWSPSTFFFPIIVISWFGNFLMAILVFILSCRCAIAKRGEQ
jgi:hypothetical protein